MTKERHLVNRIRLYIFVMVTSFFLQGAFLSSAIESNGSTAAWIVWAVVLTFSITTATIAGVRASRLSKQYKKLKWGEE